MMHSAAIISLLATWASASLTREDCVETNAITLSASNIYSMYGPSNFTCARGAADAETNSSILTITLDADLVSYRDSTDLQLILFNANGQTDYWDPANTNAIGDFFYLPPSVDYSDVDAVPAQQEDFDSWGYTVDIRANQLDENDNIYNPIHSHATQIDDWCVGTYSIVFDMSGITRLDDDAFEWHLAARLAPRNMTYQGGYGYLYGNGLIGYNVESEDDDNEYLDSSPRLFANETVAVDGYTRPGETICIPIGEDFAMMGLPPKTIEITIEAAAAAMPLPNVTAIENAAVSDFWEVSILGYDPASASTGSYVVLEDEEEKYHYDSAGKIRFRLPRVQYDASDDDASGTNYPTCVQVTVPGGQVFEDETTAFPGNDGAYPYSVGVFVDFSITITGLEYYPVLYDFRTDGSFGESEKITNVTVDQRSIHNGDWPDREGIFIVHYERDLYNNVSIVLSDAQINEGSRAMYLPNPPSGSFVVRARSVGRSADVRPFQNQGSSPGTEFPGTYSVYGSAISSYTYSNFISGLSSDGTRSINIDLFGRPTSRTGESEVGTWMVTIDRSSSCDAAYMQTSVHATHERIQGECVFSDDCIREDDHPADGREDDSANKDARRFVLCSEVPEFDMDNGGKIMPRTRCLECSDSAMCEDGQYCQRDMGICDSGNGEYVCDNWAHSTYGTCQEKERPGKTWFGELCKPIQGTVYVYNEFSTQSTTSTNRIPRFGGDVGNRYAPNHGFCGDARFWNETAVARTPSTTSVPRESFARAILWEGVCYRGVCLECDPDLTVTSADDSSDRSANGIPAGKHCVNGRIVATTVVDNTHRTLDENVPLQVGIALFTFFMLFLILFCCTMINSTNSHRELYGEAPMSCMQWLWYIFCPFSCCCGTPARVGSGVQTSGATGKPTEHKAEQSKVSTTTTKPAAGGSSPVPAAGPGFSDGANATTV